MVNIHTGATARNGPTERLVEIVYQIKCVPYIIALYYNTSKENALLTGLFLGVFHGLIV